MARIGIFALIILSISTYVAQARPNQITDRLILQNNEQMESFLQLRKPEDTITFLHNHISDSAIYKISFNNPTLPAQTGIQHIQMDKKDYINSFIQGQQYIDDYDVKIETHNIVISNDGKKANAKQIMTEEGTMLDPQNILNKGMPFISKTTCEITYSLNKDVIQSEEASCYSQTGEITSI